MISLHRSMHSSQMYTPGPAISFLTCFCDLPQKLHLSSSPVSPNFAMSPPPRLDSTRSADGTCAVHRVAGRDHVIDDAIREGLVRFHHEVAVRVEVDALQRLAAVLGEDLLQEIAHPQDLLGRQLQIRDLAVADLAVRLVQEDAAVRQREALALGTGGEQHGGGRGGLAEAD